MLNQFNIPRDVFDGPVLVTGAGGCIGAWTLSLLTDAEVEVVAFDLSDNKRRPSFLIEEEKLNNILWMTGDISDTETVMNTVEKMGCSERCVFDNLLSISFSWCFS